MLITNAQLVGPAGRITGWVLTEGSLIKASGTGDAPEAPGHETIDAGGAMLLPGLADTHVHFREPGLEHKATVRSESLAAVAGGITAVFDMPNTKPATTTVEALRQKKELAVAKGCYVRYTPLLGLVPGAMDELRRLDTTAAPAVKLFLGTSTGAMASPEGSELDDAFRFCAEHRLPIIVHAEDNDIIAANTAAAVARYGSPEAVPVSMHPDIRSAEACFRSAAYAVELAHRFGTRLHLAHVSTAREARELLQPGATHGKLVTAETTPLYLDPVLCHPSNRSSLHKVNPAIKTEADATGLREALADGRIDTIGTDHAPHLRAEKLLPGITAMSGAPSIQFALPLMLTYLPAEMIVAKMTAGPAAVFDIVLNTAFAPGSPADFSLVRETGERTITDADVLSLCGWTPFEGRTVRHTVERVWIAGQPVWNGGPVAEAAPDCDITVDRSTQKH